MADPTFLIDSAGEIKPVDAAAVPDALQLGWTQANPDQIANFQAQAKYGAPGQEAIAGLEGAGRGLTFGLSTLAERGFGVPPEDIAGREKANPIAAGAGEAAGVALPLVATLGGASAFTGPRLALRAGEVVTEHLAPEAAASLATRILGGGAAAAAGSAVEGAFYGAGRVVHEAALGDPNLTAESALATIGLSAAVMGSAGGMGKMLGSIAKEYAPRQIGAKVDELLMRAEAHSNFNATNAMPGTIKALMRGKGEGAEAIGLEARDLGILRGPLADSPDAILDRAEAVKTQVGQDLDVLAKTANQVNAATGEGVATWTKIYQDVHEPITRELMAHGDTVPIAKEFDRVLGNFAEANAGRDLGASDLWRLRQDFDAFIYKNGRVLDPWVRDVNAPINRVRSHIDQLLQNAIEKGAGPDGLEAWTAANRQYEVASTFSTLAESGIERNAANNPLHISGMMGAAAGVMHGGPLGGALLGGASEMARRRGAAAVGAGARMLREALGGAGGDLADKTADAVAAARHAGGNLTGTQEPAAVTVLAALEKNNQKVARTIDSAAAAMLGGRALSVVCEETADAASKYSERVAEIQRLAQDPAQMQSALTAQTQDWYEHAPQTAQALNTLSARAISFLAGKVPRVQSTGPFGPELQPSQAEMAVFARYWEAAHRPLVALKQAANGTITNEGLEALRAVYPALLPKFQAAVTHAAAGKTVPYQARMTLSRVMGQEMDSSLAQPYLAIAAGTFAQPQPQGGMAAGGRSSAGKLTLGKRSMTPMQAAAERGE